MYGDISNLRLKQANEIDETVIYRHYLRIEPEIKTKYFSPFSEEKTPSFCFFNKDGKMYFKCFSSGRGGTAIKFVSELFNESYEEAACRVVDEIYSNKRYNHEDIIKKVKLKESKEAVIEVVTRNLNSRDIDYWNNIGINEEDLKFYDIKPCSEVWLDDKLWYKGDELCYRYRLGNKYKIYMPMRKKKKWISNAKLKHVQGLRYLTEGKLLVISKSYKDLVVIRKHLSVNSIAYSSESAFIPMKHVDYYNSLFERVLILYDNDEPGIRYSKMQSKNTGYDYVVIPSEYDSKDPSELYENHGEEVFKKVMCNLLKIKK